MISLPPGGAAARAVRAPLVTLATAALAAVALAVPELFELTREGLREGELWRLLGGHLAHFSAGHFAVDVGMFLALGLLYEPRYGSARWALLTAGSALALSAGVLLAEPDVDVYRGLSGVDCAAFSAAVLAEMRSRRLWGRALAAAFGAKLAFEQVSGAFLFPASGLGDMGLPIPSVHLLGAAVGAGLARTPALPAEGEPSLVRPRL